MLTNIGPMFLIYIDSEGNHHYQPWQDVVVVGTLIDPETGDDMDILGWTESVPG